MKRDLELVRELLLLLEKRQGMRDVLEADKIVLESWSSDEIVYNSFLLRDANYVVAIDLSSMAKDNLALVRMTNTGHDYLDSVRDNNVWNSVKSQLVKVGGGASLEVVQSVATALILKLVT